MGNVFNKRMITWSKMNKKEKWNEKRSFSWSSRFSFWERSAFFFHSFLSFWFHLPFLFLNERLSEREKRMNESDRRSALEEHTFIPFLSLSLNSLRKRKAFSRVSSFLIKKMRFQSSDWHFLLKKEGHQGWRKEESEISF